MCREKHGKTKMYQYNGSSRLLIAVAELTPTDKWCPKIIDVPFTDQCRQTAYGWTDGENWYFVNYRNWESAALFETSEEALVIANQWIDNHHV